MGGSGRGNYDEFTDEETHAGTTESQNMPAADNSTDSDKFRQPKRSKRNDPMKKKT
jgi:hypothetical protein